MSRGKQYATEEERRLLNLHDRTAEDFKAMKKKMKLTDVAARAVEFEMFDDRYGEFADKGQKAIADKLRMLLNARDAEGKPEDSEEATENAKDIQAIREADYELMKANYQKYKAAIHAVLESTYLYNDTMYFNFGELKRALMTNVQNLYYARLDELRNGEGRAEK